MMEVSREGVRTVEKDRVAERLEEVGEANMDL